MKKLPNKENSRSIFSNAITSGKIIKKPCEVCGIEKSEGHHKDYSKPFEVMWLCRRHHNEWHKNNPPVSGIGVGIGKTNNYTIKDKSLRIRLDKEMVRRLKRLAKQAKMTVSEFIRSLIMNTTDFEND